MRRHRHRRETTIRRTAKPRKPLRACRAKTLELLESREMLAGDLVLEAPWQNPMNSRDVNFDQRVTPHDVLLIINDLALHGSHNLEATPATPLTSGIAANLRYLDVSGDNRVTPLDVLMVINELADEELMLVHTYPTDLVGNPITTIEVGNQFMLRTDVQDIRDPVPDFSGVFSAAADVTFNSALSTVDSTDLEFDSFWNLKTDETISLGRIVGYGATLESPPGSDVQVLWNAVLTATSAGLQSFTTAFDTDILHECLVFGVDDTLTADQVQFMGSTLEITSSLPVISIGDVAQEEDSGTPFLFTVSLSAPNENEAIGVSYFSSNGTAMTGDGDYDFASGTLVFDPGETMLTIPVTVNPDGDIEDDETFFVSLTGPSANATIGDGLGQGTIVNDDSPPALSISDATAAAGSEETEAIFTVTLSGQIIEPVSVGYSTQNDTAIAGVDYEAKTGNLVFTPEGPTFQEISIPILPNTTPQADLTFFVNLSSANITIEDDRGIGTIITQGISISDASVVEGAAGNTTDAVFTVSLSRTSDDEVTVQYATAEGTATTGDDDYQATNGTLTFASGTTQQMITVVVNGDDDPEPNEQFSVNLSNAVGAPLFDAEGIGTIRNDDGAKVGVRLELTNLAGVPLPLGTPLDVGDVFVLDVLVTDLQPEPGGVFQTYVDVAYPSAAVMPITSSIVFGDFYQVQRLGMFETGLLNDFGAIGETNPPADPGEELLLFSLQFEAVDVGVANFVGSVEDVNPGLETLVYHSDDPVNPEEINIENRSVNIGENVITVAAASAVEGSGAMFFTVTRFLPEDTTATVEYSTDDGTATAVDDYVAQTGTLTFMPGESNTQTITVILQDDQLDEEDETFSIVLSNPVNAATSVTPATGTILDDDGPPDVSVASASGFEGMNVVFTASLSAESGKTVTVEYNTSDLAAGNAATAGVDYTPTSGTVTFAPGETQQFITVEALDDLDLEPSETFQLALSNPQNVELGTAQAQGTIIDVPPAGIFGFVYADLNNNGIKEANETGIPGAIVTVTRTSDGMTHTAVTGADGRYAFAELFPGTYTIKETQPGFYNDGKDTRFGVPSPVNDQFSNVVLASSASEMGFNFGELGVRSEFISAFINRRALFATASVGGTFGPTLTMPGSTLNLHSGDVWVSFDGGWDGLRVIEAQFDSSQGTVSMKLYNNALQEIAVSAPTATGAALLYSGQTGSPYFLRVSGTNSNVSVEISEPALPASALSATSGGGTTGDTNPPLSDPPSASTAGGRFASSAPAAQPLAAPDSEPLVSSDASDEALAEDEDWLLQSLLV